MGPCQGKMCHRLAIDLCAAMTGRTVGETGATTARPPTVPVPLGALAVQREDPVKLTSMHNRHVARRATLMDMGAWKRPLVYSSVEEECRAGSVWCLRVKDLKITRAFYLATHRERSRSPLAEAFRAFVEAEAV